MLGDPVILPPEIPVDDIGRPIITPDQQEQIHNALRLVDPDAKAALLIFADLQTNTVRANFAWKVGKGWTVGAGAGFAWEGRRPEAWVGVEKVWK